MSFENKGAINLQSDRYIFCKIQNLYTHCQTEKLRFRLGPTCRMRV